MSTPRDIRLTPAQLALKLATREAVQAAGGQELVAGVLGCAQSRVSDYCSPNTADFIPLDKVAKLEALTIGAAGHPHISRALGFVLAGSAPAEAPEALDVHLPRIAGETGDLMRKLAEAVAMKGQHSPAQRAAVMSELTQLLDAALALYGDLIDARPGDVVSREMEMPHAPAAVIPIRREGQSASVRKDSS